MAVPLSPEEEARIASYYGGTPGVNMSDAGTPPMSVEDPAAAYYGPPPGQTSAPAAPPPVSSPADSMTGEFKLGAQLSEAPMAPPPPVGPTMRDNREFEAFKAQQAAKPKPAVSSGPGRPANPDPYGIRGAERQMVGSYEQQKGATTNIANTESARVDDVTSRQRDLAKRKQADIEAQFVRDEDANRRFDSSMAEVQRQLDEVKSRKIRPLAHLADNPGLQFASILGGIFGGIYQAVNHLSSNPFLDQMNKMADQQIAVDEKNIDNERAAVGQKMNLLQQQRATFRDNAAARLQLKNLYYEAAKDEIAAEASKYDSPLYQERARMAIGDLEREQGKLMRDLGAALQAKDQAAAAQAYARMKEVRDFRNQVYDKVLAAGYTPAQAEVEANRQTAIVYAPGTASQRGANEGYESGGLTKEQRGKVTMEHAAEQHASDEFNSQIDIAKQHPVLNDLGIGTAMASKLGQRIAPESSKTVQDLASLNTQILNAIGKTAKDAEGKPSQTMLHLYEERFRIEPSDTKEIAIRKLEGARNVVNALARQQGAHAPEPNAQVKIDSELGAKPVR